MGVIVNMSTTMIIENRIVKESKLNVLAMLVKPGEFIPLDLINGDIEYIIESENSEKIKFLWDTSNDSMKISCIKSAIDDKTKSLVDVIEEKIENTS